MIARVLRLAVIFAVMLSPVASFAADYSPFKVEARYNFIDDADFESSEAAGQHMNFVEAYAEGVYTQPLCEAYGLLVSAGFIANHIDWEGNSFFNERDFAYYTFGLGAYTMGVCEWMWVAQAWLNIDVETTDHDNMLLSGLLWGKHDYCCRGLPMHLHFGFVGDTGQEKTLILPIIGADWIAYDCWKVSLIFPLDVSVSYLVNDCLSVSSGLRFFYRRYRLGCDEPLSCGVIQYTNVGLETAMEYNHPCGLGLEGHIGWAFEGDLKVADSEGHNSSHFKTDGAAYIGAEASWKF